jgi:type II restriction enzyme
MFTPHQPIKDRVDKHWISILWPDGMITESVITWYGKKTRREYRLTRFGEDFPWLTADSVGDLFVLIPKTDTEFIAYVLDNDRDIGELQAALGVEMIGTWGIYREGLAQIEDEENENACLDRQFRAFVETIEKFPKGIVLSRTTQKAILDCLRRFGSQSADKQLIRMVKEEFRLFKMLERKIFLPEVQSRMYVSVDDFTEDAKKITQARKARAGRALENHVEYLFTQAGIPFEMRRIVDETRPDVIIPGKAAYDDPHYPLHKLLMIGIKTTCKDRWRQVTKEAPRIAVKHILTLQEGISSKQLTEMEQANVTLIVPKSLHKKYPKQRGITMLDLESFITSVKRLHAT